MTKREFNCETCGAGDGPIDVKYKYNKLKEEEWLACKCRKCGFMWTERTSRDLDAEAEEIDEADTD